MINDLLDNLNKWLDVGISRGCISNKGKDIKLSADFYFNAKISEYLERNFPYPVLSEEQQNSMSWIQFDGYYWIIDPLDGSMNFFRNIPLNCISIALFNGQTPVAGLIWDFNHNDVFIGATQPSEFLDKTGAWLNDESITTSNTLNKNTGILSIGFPSFRDYSKKTLLPYISKVIDWKKLRLLGSAALSLAWVANGRIDAYYEEDIRIWDVAAGVAITQAAGGEVYLTERERTNFVTCVVTNGKIPISELI